MIKIKNVSLKIVIKFYNLIFKIREIEYIVRDYTLDLINDNEMTEWVRAIYDHGMEFEETLDYTNAIINSGQKIDFKKDGIYIDKHSTGGVGDKV